MWYTTLDVFIDMDAKEIKHTDMVVDGFPYHAENEERHTDDRRLFPPTLQHGVKIGKSGVLAVDLDEADAVIGRLREGDHVLVDAVFENVNVVFAAAVIVG